MIRFALLGAMLSLTGCMSLSSMVHDLSKSERSWCLNVTSVWANVRIGGSGADLTSVLCSHEAFKHDSSGGGVATSMYPSSGGAIIIPAPPRVLMQEAPTYQEIDPSTLPRSPLPAVRPAPPRIKPQSMPDYRIKDLLEQIRFMR